MAGPGWTELALLLGDSLLDIGIRPPSPAAETATSPASGRGDILFQCRMSNKEFPVGAPGL